MLQQNTKNITFIGLLKPHCIVNRSSLHSIINLIVRSILLLLICSQISIFPSYDPSMNNGIPKSDKFDLIRVGKQLVELQLQYQYQTQTRLQGCIPAGIYKQSKFRYSVNNNPLQGHLQLLYTYTASRSLDFIINDTKTRLAKTKQHFYTGLSLQDEYYKSQNVDFKPIHDKIKSSMHITKMMCQSRHQGKLSRDLNSYRYYINSDGTSHSNTENWTYNPSPATIKLPSSLMPTPKKRNRRFKHKQPQKKRHNRLTRGRFKRRNMKSEQLKNKGSEKPTIPRSIDVNKYFRNLTNLEINDDQKYIFYLCQKFTPTPFKVDWSNFEKDIDQWSYVLRWTYKLSSRKNTSSKLERSLVKKSNRTPIYSSNCPALELYIELVKKDLLHEKNLSKKVHDNLHPDHRQALNSMKHWEKDHDIIIRPFDKGDGLIIDYKNNYKDKVVTELNTSTYEKITDKQQMRDQVIKLIHDWIQKWSHLGLSENLIKWLLPSENNQPGAAYMNYKVHKPGLPGRLITSGCNSFTENLSDFTAIFLKERQKILPHITLDINQFLRRIEDLNERGYISDKKIIHVSFDVISMFPNIPKDLGLKMCTAELNKRPKQDIPTDCIIEALDITLDNNICQFDNQWYRQLIGTAMGPHNACEYADISMSYIDNLVNSPDNPHLQFIGMWSRYRDDVYVPWIGDIEQLNLFLDWLNSQNDQLKFTMEFGDSIAYLDVTVYDENGFIKTKLHSKPTDTHAYLLPSSCHPLHVCEAIPKSVARRVKKLNDPSNYENSVETFTKYLLNRGYSENSIREAFGSQNEVERQSLYAIKTEQKSVKRSYPLISEFNPRLPKVSKVLNKHKHVLELDSELCKIINPDSIFASFR